MNRTWIVVIGVVVGLAAAFLVYHFAGSNVAAEPAGEHHGMSPAVWVAVFTAVWIPLVTGAARRRKDRAKKDNQDKGQ